MLRWYEACRYLPKNEGWQQILSNVPGNAYSVCTEIFFNKLCEESEIWVLAFEKGFSHLISARRIRRLAFHAKKNAQSIEYLDKEARMGSEFAHVKTA